MKKVVVETFGKAKETLTASLESEAIDGVLDLEQLFEAIKSIDIQCSDEVVNYMLYYVFVRSESSTKLEYQTLIDLLQHLV